jgi:hypothetical protein
MRRVIVFLNGGLGNQMFQYAAGRALALRNGVDLVLDTWSGFIRDFQYRRHYELDALPIQARAASPWERMPIWLYRADKRLRGIRETCIQPRWYGRFLVETDFEYLVEVAQAPIDGTTWLVGYWQSPRYFSEYDETLRGELMPPAPVRQRFLDMGRLMRESESVALGVRLYEESANPAAHARDGRVKTAGDINGVIAHMRSQRPDARFFVFCTQRSPMFEQLDLPESTVFVTHDDGYKGTLETLWLLSQCRHHVFTNSSYYWWGAWLSTAQYGATSGGQQIIAADNFVNRDALCVGWETF